jgi:hypothetical protein
MFLLHNQESASNMHDTAPVEILVIIVWAQTPQEGAVCLPYHRFTTASRQRTRIVVAKYEYGLMEAHLSSPCMSLRDVYEITN